MLELNWNKGAPSAVGTYFVAAEYGPGTGMFEIMDWDGEKWDTYPTVSVIAFLTWNEFKQQLNLKWPGEMPVMPPRPPLADEDLAFEEV